MVASFLLLINFKSKISLSPVAESGIKEYSCSSTTYNCRVLLGPPPVFLVSCLVPATFLRIDFLRRSYLFHKYFLLLYSLLNLVLAHPFRIGKAQKAKDFLTVIFLFFRNSTSFQFFFGLFRSNFVKKKPCFLIFFQLVKLRNISQTSGGC